ncbi:MAG TPA: hypothetical protein VFX59_08385 [Polyangiales bacterium]|nr:hypothetical protein [Polyangiales bacterium]
MISSPLVRAALCVLLIGCAGARAPGTAAGPVSAEAPSWARVGDEKTGDGTLFVCEGEGADEQQATDAARAICSGKICELCGVEVKSSIETHETLDKVEVERKVVETCRRVRKGDEEIRYRQAGCGPKGCQAWLQVFFSAESEARECRAYADGNFADSGQCEELIEQFRRTPDRTAQSFHVRAELLSRAIIACAEIDVRPTPKLTALDEILWQGVVSPRAELRPRRPIDKAQPISQRLQLMAENASDAWKTEYAEHAYKAIDRQPLLESKVFVDRVARIRDAMIAYESIMTAMEAVVDTEHNPDAVHDNALVAALRGLKPVAGGWTPDRVLAWVADELSRNRATLRLPGIKAYLMEKYAASADVGQTLMRAITSDERASDDEWKYVLGTMHACFTCATTLIDLPEHGGDAKRLARLVELSRTASTDSHVKALQGVYPELLLRAEPSFDAALAARIFSYEWFEQWLRKLPALGDDVVAHTLHQSWTSSSYDWRWTVSPAQHKAFAARAWQLLQAKSLRCDDWDKELSLLEVHGVDTRALESTLCRCASESKSNGMRDLTELYQRLVAWGASCARKEG